MGLAIALEVVIGAVSKYECRVRNLRAARRSGEERNVRCVIFGRVFRSGTWRGGQVSAKGRGGEVCTTNEDQPKLTH
jgi:hypothetical protein